jgi:(E)-4-hydroxy-3-methylbut-2-enyl-diphosphate synthase
LLREKFVHFLEICKKHDTAVRIGVNHGSLSERMMNRYGDTPLGMVESCLELLRICREENFDCIVISLKASNTVLMIHAVRLLVERMDAEDFHFPLHLGVTEAGDGEDGRIKSAIGIGTLLADGIGDTIRVSLSEAPENEIPVAFSILQATRTRISKAEYIACPSCGRTLFDLQTTLKKVKEATSHLKNLKIAVMGCIVNGPGEMADADYGYVGAGKGKISLYKGKICVEKNIPEEFAVEKLMKIIEKDNLTYIRH